MPPSYPPIDPSQIDMLDIINDEFGTDYDYDTPWDQVLAPGTIPLSPTTADAEGLPQSAPVDLTRLESMLAGADLPSEDDEDEDYQ